MAADTDRFSLAGRNAVVTGASRGIGRAIALAFAQAGANVAILARSADDLEAVADEIRGAGGTAVAVPCDVTALEAASAAVQASIDALGHVDVLVNNAGGPVFNAPFLDIRDDGWSRVFELNLFAVVRMLREIGAHMVGRSSGSVINVDSIGSWHPAATVGPYCAAKAAVLNLTQTLAQEWGPAGVRVNALSPGLIDTKINSALVSHPEIGPAAGRSVPLGRWGTPDDIAGAAVWLASEASAYVTGAHIWIDGGLGVVAPQTQAMRMPGPGVRP